MLLRRCCCRHAAANTSSTRRTAHDRHAALPAGHHTSPIHTNNDQHAPLKSACTVNAPHETRLAVVDRATARSNVIARSSPRTKPCRRRRLHTIFSNFSAQQFLKRNTEKLLDEHRLSKIERHPSRQAIDQRRQRNPQVVSEFLLSDPLLAQQQPYATTQHGFNPSCTLGQPRINRVTPSSTTNFRNRSRFGFQTCRHVMRNQMLPQSPHPRVGSTYPSRHLG